jgi:tetratricopeptide (TPR) repeat protein
LELANLLHDSGFFDRAIENYKKYLEIKPNSTNALVDMGICYFELQNYASADSVMKIAIKIEPQHQQANFNLGIVNLAAGKIDESKEWFKKAIAIDPNSEIGKKAEQILQSH